MLPITRFEHSILCATYNVVIYCPWLRQRAAMRVVVWNVRRLSNSVGDCARDQVRRRHVNRWLSAESYALLLAMRDVACSSAPVWALRERRLHRAAMKVALLRRSTAKKCAFRRVCALSQVLSTLRLLQPSLIALNEVSVESPHPPHSVSELAEALGLRHYAFFGHVRGTYGNALISAAPIQR
eukprot:6202074-Pleurochrysis_carterae.AAC.1